MVVIIHVCIRLVICVQVCFDTGCFVSIVRVGTTHVESSDSVHSPITRGEIFQRNVLDNQTDLFKKGVVGHKITSSK